MTAFAASLLAMVVAQRILKSSHVEVSLAVVGSLTWEAASVLVRKTTVFRETPFHTVVTED